MGPKISLTRKMIDDAPNVKLLLELEPIKDNWIRTYEDTTGNKDGESKFATEKLLLLQAVESSSALQKCDKFSVYSAFMQLAISGLTLADGICYIYPFGKKAAFIVGWKGRLEQVNRIPNVVYSHEPQVVYDCDDFSYHLGEAVRIEKHKRGKRTETSQITHVYWVIEFLFGTRVYVMEREDVLKIRDKYSSSYIQYVNDCKQHGKKVGETFKKTVSNGGSAWDMTVEPPMWISDEPQAWKKTIVRRVWGTLPKLAIQKYLDDLIAKENIQIDPDENRNFDNYLAIQNDTIADPVSQSSPNDATDSSDAISGPGAGGGNIDDPNQGF